MSDTSTVTTRRRVAIIGGGVSGLSAAWHLITPTKTNTPGDDNDHDCDVILFESQDRIGGHAWTKTMPDGTDIDIGFMVFNDSNYPNLTRWFQELGVADEPSDMSLSVSLDQGAVEWSSDALFANPRQLVSPAFYKCLADMLRFHANAADILTLSNDDPRTMITTGQYLKDHNYSSEFASYYLLPMMAALWSASKNNVLQFPAKQLIAFLCNHKMLQLFDRPQWKTVAGRSQQYTKKMETLLGKDRIRLNTPITTVKRTIDGTYQLYTTDEQLIHDGTFHHVIFACHPPAIVKMLHTLEASKEKLLLSLLSDIEYADNDVYIHSDPSLMPKRQCAWASWNCLGKQQELVLQKKQNKKKEAFEGGESGFGNVIVTPKEDPGRMTAVYVTYWLNRLQHLNTTTNYFVSLNPHVLPAAELTQERLKMAHPQFTPATLQARERIKQEYQGRDGLWFCGAWQGYGFHEDGCRSGFQVATQLSGVPLPWASDDEPVLPPPDLAIVTASRNQKGIFSRIHSMLTYDLPVAICRPFILHFLNMAVVKGRLTLKFNNGSTMDFGDGSPCGSDNSPVVMRIFDPWFFVKTALEYDLGLARSYMAGYFVVEPLPNNTDYDPVIRPLDQEEEANTILGDPIGLTRLFLLLIGNRDSKELFQPRKAGRGNRYSNAFSNASGLIISKIGSFLNYLRYKLTMDNSERGGSLKNIHAHYDLSNDLFTTFLDKETLMYSSAIYDAVKAPSDRSGLVFRGTLEEAQLRKLDTLLDRAQIQPGQEMLDIGFGWGGLSLHAAKKYGCKVTGITLSVEQKALAEVRVRQEGLGHLITFEVCDYRTFARRPTNQGRFDRVLSCEMIEAVGHEHLGEFFWAVEQVLTHDGILVMEAITTPEMRYETYLRSTDFINTIIFPGSCCPSLHALVDAAYKQSCLTLEHIDNIGLHYARTLAEWRRRFNANEDRVRMLGFDDVFMRVWNYYMTYCEAGFHSQTENCLILVFSRQGCQSLVPLCETRCVTQASALTDTEINNWLS